MALKQNLGVHQLVPRFLRHDEHLRKSRGHHALLQKPSRETHGGAKAAPTSKKYARNSIDVHNTGAHHAHHTYTAATLVPPEHD